MLIALVVGVFLTLSAYVVTSLNTSLHADRVVQRVYAKQRAYHALVSIVPYVLDALRKDKKDTDTLSDPWALPLVVETEEGELEIRIRDEDRFFNLNTVGRGETHGEVFGRLLELLGISPAYLHRVRDLIEEKGALLSPHELRHIGMGGEELYGRREGDVRYPGILELVTVWSSGRININTAPKYVLMALDPSIDETVAQRIMEYRASKPFKRVEDFVLVEGVTFDTLHRISSLIDVRSTHFRVELSVRNGDVETTLSVIYDRKRDRIVFGRIY